MNLKEFGSVKNRNNRTPPTNKTNTKNSIIYLIICFFKYINDLIVLTGGDLYE